MNRVIESPHFDPAYNLALEEALLSSPREGVLLYLWQNRDTVVIGRNQNAWKECRVRLLESEGGRLVRRSSGGGAVFHDLGNLNFSFVMDRPLYDVQRQLSVVARALASFGLRAEISGRNDMQLLPTGGKFSGSAFRIGARCLHHGTILVDTDMDKLARYLAPSAQKLAARGVASVRARVTNLSAHAPALTVERVKNAMQAAFIALYGPAEPLEPAALDPATLETLRARYDSPEWTFGRTPAFDFRLDTRFAWGGAELVLRVVEGRVREAALYTDAMDETLSARVEAALVGAAPDGASMAARLEGLSDAAARDIAGWLAVQSL